LHDDKEWSRQNEVGEPALRFSAQGEHLAGLLIFS
jgi:hypothetical protein